jgi:hypothetical protein
LLLSKTYRGLLGIAFVALSSPATANCWGDFDRPGARQFGYILVFAVPKSGDEVPRFRGVVGADDQFDYKLVSVEFSETEGERFASEPPTILAIVGDVEVLDSGLRSIKVRAVLGSVGEVQEAKKKSDSTYPGACVSTFAAHWKAG